MDAFLKEMLGGAGRLQENVGMTLFLEKKYRGRGALYKLNPDVNTWRLLHVIYSKKSSWN